MWVLYLLHSSNSYVTHTHHMCILVESHMSHLCDPELYEIVIAIATVCIQFLLKKQK
jgi:hypothetical protein